MKMLKIYSAMMMLLVASSVMDAWAAGPRRAWSESDGVFYLKTGDGLEEYTVDGTITFKAVAEGSTIPTYRDCGVVFAPANEGEVLQITVNSIDLSGENYLLLYDGAIEKIGYGVGTGDQSSYLPDGYVKWYTSESVGETYTSTSSDGKLSFGFHSQRPQGQTGFDITITSMPLKDMEYRSTSVVTGLSSVNRGAKSQVIYGVDVVTDGGSNALTLNQLSIDCSALAGSTQVTNVRLYRGETAASGSLLATASTVGDALTASDVTLKTGTNRFVVIADVLPDATGTIPSLTLSQVTVAGNDCTPQETTGDAVSINNVILMTSEATTFTIDEAATFYDDGGKDGKIGEKFTGTITFVPATEGNAIKVDFSKFAIFNTSSVGYNDIFKFYNGRTADESNLITTLLEEAEVVKSTADDGSMTITLTSTTGVPADGWEAVVSQFLPDDMTLSGVTAQAASSATVAAGDTAVVLIVDVQTDNQSNALSLTGLDLQTTQADLTDNVSVYYLGKKNTLSTTNLFGEASVTGSDITVTGNQELIEGHNYLAVVVMVNEAALNGNQVNVTLKQATVGGNQVAADGEPTATRTIANICHATQGSHSHKMYDEWTFMDTKSSITPSKYEYENTDYIVTFTPAEAGHVAQLDFSAFDVTYSSSSYGTKAVFEVYSGTTVNSANLLWSLSDASQATTGPGKTLRSTAADGSMTIRFNPKTTSSYYAATGWTATVQPFKNHEMTVDSITVNQTSTDVVAVGATDAQVIDFDVVTEGSLTTTTIKQVNLDLKGCEQLLDKVTVLYNNVNDMSSAVAFGSVSAPTESNVAINGERALAEGHNYWWVTADIKSDAASEQQVDVRLVSIVDADGGVTEVAAGDPEGYRLTKNQYNMSADTTIITVVNPLMFYDDGGPDENYSKGFTGVTIFVPGVEGYAVTMNSVSFGTGSGKFYLYNGSEVNSDQLVKSPYYSATTGPENIISKADDGALTVKFEGSTYSTTSGWAIDVRLHELTPHVVDSITSEPATTASVLRGATDAPIVKGTIVVSGDRGKLQINNLTFNTQGTTNLGDIKAAKLYYTATGENFVPDNLIATTTQVTDGSVTFTADEPIEISDNGNYYFWITYDIDRQATVGNVVAATLTAATVDGEAATVVATPAQRTIKEGMRGTYVIGASEAADFATFAEATQALNEEGVEGPVTFEVEDGTYAENVKVQTVEGAGTKSTITFVGQSGDASKVVITGSGYVDQGYGSHKEGLFMIDSTSYVTVRDISLIPSSQDYPYAMHIYNQSRHVTIDNVIITAQTVTSGYSGMALVKSEAKNEEGKNNDYLTIQNSQFTGGYIALYLGGTGYIRFTRERGLVVRNNIVNEAGSKAIYVTDEDDMTIDGNSMTASLTTKADYHGIDLYRCRGAFEVKNNTIVNAMSAYSCGIELRQESRGGDDQSGMVYNNSISVTKSPSNSGTGIEVGADSRNIHLIYNTVRMAGTGGYTYYTSRNNSATYTNIKLQNNLLQNLTGSPAMFIYSTDYILSADFQRNAFYATDGVIVEGYDIDAFNTLVGNTTCIVDSAQFVSETDLRLKAQGQLVSAQPVASITTDIKGNTRDASTPTIGAYEYADIVVVTPTVTEGYPVVVSVGETTATVKTAWNVSGKLYTIVVKDGEQAPTLDELLATTPQDYTADGELNTDYSDLEPQTSYVAYYVLVSALDGSVSEIVASEVFTTLRHIETLAIDLTRPYDVIEAGGTTTIEPAVTGGDEPYTYEWRDQMNQVVGHDATLTVSPEYTWGYRLTVTSADGQTATAKTAVYVLGDNVVATFDDNYLAADSYFNGDFEGDVFYSGSYAFNVSNMDYWWYGYAMSSQLDTTYSSLSDQYRSAAGGGVNRSQFGVGYPSGLTVEVTNNLDGDIVNGVMLTNSAYAYYSMTHGDSFSKKFEQGDWFLLTIIGVHADGTTDAVEYYLADLTHENEQDNYILNTWQWVDLSSLGTVTSLRFVLSSSDTGKYGMNTPAYFCLDNLGVSDPSIAPTSVGSTVAGRHVAGTLYYNMQGMQSERPFSGVNVVVTTYSDGTRSTAKQLFK